MVELQTRYCTRFKGSNVRLELGLNNEIIDPYNDRKTLSQIGTVDKIVGLYGIIKLKKDENQFLNRFER